MLPCPQWHTNSRLPGHNASCHSSTAFGQGAGGYEAQVPTAGVQTLPSCSELLPLEERRNAGAVRLPSTSFTLHLVASMSRLCRFPENMFCPEMLLKVSGWRKRTLWLSGHAWAKPTAVNRIEMERENTGKRPKAGHCCRFITPLPVPGSIPSGIWTLDVKASHIAMSCGLLPLPPSRGATASSPFDRLQCRATSSRPGCSAVWTLSCMQDTQEFGIHPERAEAGPYGLSAGAASCCALLTT